MILVLLGSRKITKRNDKLFNRISKKNDIGRLMAKAKIGIKTRHCIGYDLSYSFSLNFMIYLQNDKTNADDFKPFWILDPKEMTVYSFLVWVL